MEPLAASVYFAPEVHEELAGLGFEWFPTGYAVSRAWGLGTCAPEVVVATFYNFAPRWITKGIPECWDKVTPEEIGAARDRGVAKALDRITEGAELPNLGKTIKLMFTALEACRPEGRPLFAATAAAPWPDHHPLLAVWHGANRCREFRGDNHIAALAAEGVDGVEALVLHAATGQVPKSSLMTSRAWTEEEWHEAADRLAARGLVVGEELTPEGRLFRESIEDRTDRLSMPPWEALGSEAESLRESVRALSILVVEAGGVPGRIGRRAVEDG